MKSLLALILLVSDPSPNEQSMGSPLTGVFSNVSYSDETGDAGGFEVALDADNSSNPTVVFTICEGGCYGGERWPVSIEGNRIAFRVVHRWKPSEGGPEWEEREDYEGVIEGDVLNLRSPQVPGADPRLPRVSNPAPGQTARLAGRTTSPSR